MTVKYEMFFRRGFNSADIEQMQLPFLREICLYLNDLPGLILYILYFGLEKSCHLGKYSEKTQTPTGIISDEF